MLDHFWDVDHGGLFTTPDDGEALVARQKDLFDNATPSANSMAAVGLYRLAALTGEIRYANHADRILQLVGAVVDQAPGAFSEALAAADLHREGITEVAVVGDRPDLVAVVWERWHPDVVLAWGEPYDSPLWEGRQTAWPTCAGTTPARLRRTPPTGCAASCRGELTAPTLTEVDPLGHRSGAAP